MPTLQITPALCLLPSCKTLDCLVSLGDVYVWIVAALTTIVGRSTIVKILSEVKIFIFLLLTFFLSGCKQSSICINIS